MYFYLILLSEHAANTFTTNDGDALPGHCCRGWSELFVNSANKTNPLQYQCPGFAILVLQLQANTKRSN